MTPIEEILDELELGLLDNQSLDKINVKIDEICNDKVLFGDYTVNRAARIKGLFRTLLEEIHHERQNR